MNSDRRFDLDWLRIGAFGLLILYHVGMFYVSWDWHVKSPRASAAIEPFMMLSSPWRLGLLFLVSGAAMRFMADRLSPGALAGSRFQRLFWPLVFGVLVVVPPQAYLEVVEKTGWGGSYAQFMGLYLTGYGGFCRGDDCLIMPTWNHLWFVAYVLVYALLLSALMAGRRFLPHPRIPARWRAALFLFGPWLWLWAMRAALWPRFGSTHALVDDWYNHAIYLPLFLLGFAIARAPDIAALAGRVRWPALGLFVLAWGGVLMVTASPQPSALALFLGRGLREAQAWAAILACLGFAWTHLRHVDTPARRWLTRAVFPCYIVHQTAIVVAGHQLARLDLPIAIEASFIILATVAACLVATLAAMRWPAAGFLLGFGTAKVSGSATGSALPGRAPRASADTCGRPSAPSPAGSTANASSAARGWD